MTGIRGSINDALVESSMVPVWLDVVDALPASALGLIPGDFSMVLQELDMRVQAEG